MNYRETIEYIHSTCWKGSRPGLERITELLSLMGNPERGMKFVHVAGTNGKGSFCAMLSSVLRRAGYRVGMFTSPYIEEFTERIQADGKDISREMLAEVTSFVRPFADAMPDTPTEFELITAIGFEFFRRTNVDIVVLECGMGGRLDSTNVIEAPLLSVITGIALDHTEYLGSTLAAIAGEKAGIIKEGCPVLFGGESEEAFEVIAKKAEEMHAVLTRTDRNAVIIDDCSADGTVFSYKDTEGAFIPLLGLYQPLNAANVIEAVHILRTRGLDIPDDALYDGLALARWKGRFERLRIHPPVFFDGGHNIEGVTAAVATVKKYFPNERINVISGVMADKRYREMAELIAGIAEKVYTVAPDNARALDAETYAEVFRSIGVPSEGFPDYASAVAAALADCESEGKPLLALGSLYAYAPFKKALLAALDTREREELNDIEPTD
ncbi:MAG: bifunctional folylpolyglutamate synthase/dihydrofolate synthase [Clostridia bacterium]|nr:bifunctional folylpolyglutamate synthase/dihydrofolate synthase [Clostridia bacterium]